MSLVPPATSLGMTRPEATSTTPVDKDWWRGAVIYQIYPRSYQDHNGDGVRLRMWPSTFPRLQVRGVP